MKIIKWLTNWKRLVLIIPLLIIVFIALYFYVFAANENVLVAGGQGTNTLAYSSDGITWTGLGTSTFSTQGYAVAWNGTRWVAGGNGTANTLAYSSDGITWTGLGTSTFSSYGYAVAWNGTRWVAGGYGSVNSLAYSSDGITWTGLGTSTFSTAGLVVVWNGTRWVAGGNGTANTLAYSSDGITWTGLGTSTFGSAGRAVAWNGTRWVAGGNVTNSLAYSSDGITWTGLGTSTFSIQGRAVAWNGTRWVAGGGGTANTLAYSSDGITWTGLGTSTFSTQGNAAAWNGTRWVAGGCCTNTLAYSSDGITWTGLGTSTFSTAGLSIASGPTPTSTPTSTPTPTNTPTPTPTPTYQSAKLVGRWRFDGNAKDSTPYGHNGTVTGATLATDRQSQVNKAYNFNGTSDHINIGNAGGLIKTISFWMQANTTSSKKIINIDGTRQIELDGSSNVVATGFPSATVYIDGSSASANIPNTNWHLVTITDPTGVTATTLDIGAVSTSYFSGKLDDIRIYNNVLSSADITKIYESYDSGLVASDLQKGLLGQWKMDGNAKDSTPYGHNGTVTGATLTTDRQSQVNKAYGFNGTSKHILIGNVGSGIKTISFWMQANATSSQTILNIDNSKRIILDGNSNVIAKYFPSVTVYIDGSSVSAKIPNTSWHLVTITDSIGFTASTFDIGTFPPIDFFNGKIDDVRIYNRVLSQEEVNLLAGSYGCNSGCSFACGNTVIDSRDGNSYATVQIGSQCWMKQNMNIYQSNACGDEASVYRFCYNGDTANCDTNNNPTYPDGGLYQWPQAMCSSTTEGAQGICPVGWHVPTDTEYETLIEGLATVDCEGSGGWFCDPAGTKLKSGGTSGFEGNLAGCFLSGFSGRLSSGYYWSSTRVDSVTVFFRELSSSNTTVYRADDYKLRYYSVRCIKN